MSVTLILEGSQSALEQIELRFKPGQLTELEGIPVKNVQFIVSGFPELGKDRKTVGQNQLALTIAIDMSLEEIEKAKVVLLGDR